MDDFHSNNDQPSQSQSSKDSSSPFLEKMGNLLQRYKLNLRLSHFFTRKSLSQSQSSKDSSSTFLKKMGNFLYRYKLNPRLSHFFTRKWLWIFVCILPLLAIGGYLIVMVQGQEVDLKKLQNIQSSSILLDKDQNEIAKIGDYQRENININEVEKVNPMLVNAFLKVEDVRFYHHSGVDFKALVRALFSDINKGGKAEGGGTITMQVARNVIIEDNNKSYSRKFKEIATAWKIERRYNKKEILQAYLNSIYLGNNVSGIQMASKLYFGKDVTKDHLEPHEVAFLAGLPKAPSKYNPFGTPEEQAAAKKRRAVVLHKMAESNEMAPLITKQQEKNANSQHLPEQQNVQLYGTVEKYAAYKKMVLNELSYRYGISEEQLSAKTFKIYTGLNPQLQEATENVLNNDDYFQSLPQLDAGTATIDVKTGLVAAIGGGRHYKSGYLVRGAYEYQQPGSSIKPLTVYAPAIDMSNGEVNENYTVPDQEMDIDGWIPQNYNRQYYGNQPLTFVVEHSLNAGTVWMLKEIVGLDNAFKYGVALGLELQEPGDKAYAPLALGGLTKGATPLQMARAYTALANNGTKIHAYSILKVEDPSGNEVTPDKDKTVSSQQVYKPTTAFSMTSILRNAVEKEDATGHNAQLADGRPIAGKTGTTSNNKAAWFAGYTSDYVTTVMVYNTSNNSKDQLKNLTGGTFPAMIFKAIMEQGLTGIPIADFAYPPETVDTSGFQLQRPQVTATYDQASNKVILNWQKQDHRVEYHIYRSDDGTNWGDQPMAKAESESTGYEDTTIQPPPSKEQPKSYFYQVYAIDTQASDPNHSYIESQVVQVDIKPQ